MPSPASTAEIPSPAPDLVEPRSRSTARVTRVLVTGVRRGGIGGAIAIRLADDAARRGAPLQLILSAPGPECELDALAEELHGRGVETDVVYADLLDPESPAQVVAGAAGPDEALDGLVLNAGGVRAAPLTELTVADWDEVFALDVRSAWLLAKAARGALVRVGGSIVATGSVAGSWPHVGLGAYGPAKAALIMLCQTLAMEWAADGIRVNSVSPGSIRTALTEPLYADPDEVQHRRRVVPLGRPGVPEEVAAVVSFLLGADASFITGEDVVIDGGLARSSLNRMILDRVDHDRVARDLTRV